MHSVIKLIIPPIKIIDGYVFNLLSFDEVQFEIYANEGMKTPEIQSWLNLIELRSVFEDIDWDTCIKLANSIISVWNTSFLNNNNGLGVARVLIEEELREIYLTIDIKQGSGEL
jgi:hypothetical protein